MFQISKKDKKINNDLIMGSLFTYLFFFLKMIF